MKSKDITTVITTKEELADTIYSTLVAKTILANQNALAHNEMLKQMPIYKGRLKEVGNQLITILINAEKKEFEKVEFEAEKDKYAANKKGSNIIDEAFKKTQRIQELMAKLVFVGYDDLEETLEALMLDRKSVMGVVRKVKRTNK